MRYLCAIFISLLLGSSPLQAQDRLSRSDPAFNDGRPLAALSGPRARGAACSPRKEFADLRFDNSDRDQETCGSTNTVNSYAGRTCTVPNVAYPGKDVVYAVVLARGNRVEFRLDLDGSQGDLMLALVGTCGDGTTCVLNSSDFIGAGVGPEVIPQWSYEVPPGQAYQTYYLYIDSFYEIDDPRSCGNYTLTITGENPPVVDLKITQEASQPSKPQPLSVAAGEPLIYTLEVFNDSPFTATGVEIVDTLPEGVVFDSAGEGCGRDGGTVVCTIGNLEGRTRETRKIEVTVDPSFRGELVNRVEVRGSNEEEEANPDNNVARDLVTAVTAEANLTIGKTDGETEAVPGEQVRYTITVVNHGPSDVPEATVTDLFPATLRDCTWTCEPSRGAQCTSGPVMGEVDDTVNLPSGVLSGHPTGGVAKYTATCTIDPSATGSLSNTAAVTVRPEVATERNPANNRSTDVDTLVPTADLSIRKTDGKTEAIPGNEVRYSITVRNDGPSDAPGATVRDDPPAELQDCTWTCAAFGGGSCTAGPVAGNIDDVVDLPAGADVTYILTCTIDPSAVGSLVNSAQVIAPPGVTDPSSGNNRKEDRDTLIPTADCAITKTDGQETAVPGKEVTYTIIATNPGPSDAPGAEVQDRFPAALKNCEWTCDPDDTAGTSCTAGLVSGDIVDVVDLPAGASVTYTATCTIDAGATGNLENTATLAPPEGVNDPVTYQDSGINRASDVDTLTPQADLSIAKDDGQETARPSETVTYTIRVANEQGPSDVREATVTDEFPPELAECNWTCAADSDGPPGVECIPDPLSEHDVSASVNLPVNGAVTFTATCSVVATNCANNPTGLLNNEAWVRWKEGPSGQPETITDTDGDELRPRLTVRKAGSGSGTVTDSEGSLILDADCAEAGAEYHSCTEVTLTATWDADSTTFAGWSGGCANGLEPEELVEDSITLTMDDNQTCTATFDLIGSDGRCLEPMDDLVAWWPFDERSGPEAIDVAGGHNGIYGNGNGPTPDCGMVDFALRFAAGEYVEVDDAPTLNFGASPAGDFSIVFWIKTTEQETGDEERKILIDKRPAADDGGGYCLFLEDGRPGLLLDDGQSGEAWFLAEDGSSVADGDWHLVAVTVDRHDPSAGLWYVDGMQVGDAFDPIAVPGAIESSQPLRIGSPAIDEPPAEDGFFVGLLDEVMIFHRVLSEDDNGALFLAGRLGQCKESVYLQRDTPICTEPDTGRGRLAICNRFPTEQHYSLSFAGVSADDCGTEIDGPGEFAVLGSDPEDVAVASRSCKMVEVSIGPPEDMNGDHREACFQVTVTNRDTGAELAQRGSVWYSPDWCAMPSGDFPIDQPIGELVEVAFDVTKTQDETDSLPYELAALPSDDDPDGTAVQFDGLDPGESVIGEVEFSDERSETVSARAKIPEPRPFVVYDLRLRDSLTGAVLASTGIRSVADLYGSGGAELRLHGGRYQVRVDWHDAEGHGGVGHAVALSDSTGYFWFFDEDNVELVVKVLDGRPINGNWWVFYGALSNLAYTVTVTDTADGVTKRYENPAGQFASVADPQAFAGAPEDGGSTLTPRAFASGSETLTLNDGRFRVDVEWTDSRGDGGPGRAVPLTADTGYFWFFGAANVELVVKILDGRAVNGHWWVFYGALSNVEYTITVTDVATGAVRTWFNPLGRFASEGDATAFQER